MDHTEMNIIDENKSNTIRKKSSFLRDSSYRIFHITNKSKEDSGDDDDNRTMNNNIDQTIDKKNNKSRKKSLKITNRNGLKQILFLHKTNCESSSIETKNPPSSYHELSQSVICNDRTSVELLKKKNKQETITDWSKANVTDETTANSTVIIRADKFEPKTRKSVFINIHPEIQASVHRRQKRFIVACGTVLLALSFITTIIIYVIIMTIKHKTKMNQSQFHDHLG